MYKYITLYILFTICVSMYLLLIAISVGHNNKLGLWPAIQTISFYSVEIFLIYIHIHMIRI